MVHYVIIYVTHFAILYLIGATMASDIASYRYPPAPLTSNLTASQLSRFAKRFIRLIQLISQVEAAVFDKMAYQVFDEFGHATQKALNNSDSRANALHQKHRESIEILLRELQPLIPGLRFEVLDHFLAMFLTTVGGHTYRNYGHLNLIWWRNIVAIEHNDWSVRLDIERDDLSQPDTQGLSNFAAIIVTADLLYRQSH